MEVSSHYEALIIGSGEGGKFVAWTLAKAGQRTALIERKLIGGSCPNIACLPTKNVIHSAKVADLARHAAQFGIETGDVRVDMRGVIASKKRMVDGLIQMHLDRFRTSGAELIMGHAHFTAPKIVEVALNDGGTQAITADKIFLSLGTHATIPDVPGLAESKPLTHIETLELDRVPEHLVVLGGGYVGLEMAQAFRRFGARVTVLERGTRLLSKEDPDISSAMLDLLCDEGIQVLFDTQVLAVEGESGEAVQLMLKSPHGPAQLDGSHVLVATGRTPNTHGIGLDLAGIALTDNGYIQVNDRLETTAKDVWALGECAGSPQFTHVAFDDFRTVAANVLGHDRSTKGRLVPFCLFTDPELGRVGLTETEAEAAGISYRLAKLPMVGVLRTRTLGETRGFMKMLIALDSDRILGFTAFGTGAGELIAVVQTAMLGQLPYTLLRDAIFAHPTIAEGMSGLLASVSPGAPAPSSEPRA